jgi:hypothetical protein
LYQQEKNQCNDCYVPNKTSYGSHNQLWIIWFNLINRLHIYRSTNWSDSILKQHEVMREQKATSILKILIHCSSISCLHMKSLIPNLFSYCCHTFYWKQSSYLLLTTLMSIIHPTLKIYYPPSIKTLEKIS